MARMEDALRLADEGKACKERGTSCPRRPRMIFQDRRGLDVHRGAVHRQGWDTGSAGPTRVSCTGPATRLSDDGSSHPHAPGGRSTSSAEVLRGDMEAFAVSSTRLQPCVNDRPGGALTASPGVTD